MINNRDESQDTFGFRNVVTVFDWKMFERIKPVPNSIPSKKLKMNFTI
tara:strand:+ start:428 stop:571 length:144 start_codon:yes stop_codon:yes gene_type:complete